MGGAKDGREGGASCLDTEIEAELSVRFRDGLAARADRRRVALDQARASVRPSARASTRPPPSRAPASIAPYATYTPSAPPPSLAPPTMQAPITQRFATVRPPPPEASLRRPAFNETIAYPALPPPPYFAQSDAYPSLAALPTLPALPPPPPPPPSVPVAYFTQSGAYTMPSPPHASFAPAASGSIPALTLPNDEDDDAIDVTPSLGGRGSAEGGTRDVPISAAPKRARARVTLATVASLVAVMVSLAVLGITVARRSPVALASTAEPARAQAVDAPHTGGAAGAGGAGAAPSTSATIGASCADPTPPLRAADPMPPATGTPPPAAPPASAAPPAPPVHYVARASRRSAATAPKPSAVASSPAATSAGGGATTTISSAERTAQMLRDQLNTSIQPAPRDQTDSRVPPSADPRQTGTRVE